jgi:two-component system sensor histidine kinase QseC
MRSLRKNLILGTTIGTAAVLLSVGILLYTLVRSGMTDQFDRSMLDEARLLASTVEQKHERTSINFEEIDMREFETPSGPGYVQLFLPDGSVLFRSPSLGRANLEFIASIAESPTYSRVILPNGKPGRAVSITFMPQVEDEYGQERESESFSGKSAPKITLVLARDTAPIDSSLALLRIVLISVGLGAIAVLAGVLQLVIRRGLKPLNQIAAQISQLGEQYLSARVSVYGAPQELEPVTERLNDLLHRLEAAFQRERLFSADVAHELRTPLSGLRSTIDVILSKPRQTTEYQEALSDCRKITAQMQSMTENLLSLARLDAGQIEVRPEPLSQGQLISNIWKQFGEEAESRHLRVQWILAPQTSITTDLSLLTLVIRNILENAVSYSDVGGWIRIETTTDEGKTVIRVTNSGGILTQEDAEHAFERFWRGDAARTAATVHCGLGLSLVKKSVALLGGSVSVRSSPGGEFQITVSLPNQ